jgi:hypothetical protein
MKEVIIARNYRAQQVESVLSAYRSRRMAALEQRACSFAWTEYDDFYGKRFLSERRCISGTAATGTD